MKTKITISLLAVAGALGLATGCGKTEKAAPPAATNAPAPAGDAITEAKTAAEAARKAEMEKVAERAKTAEAQLKAEAEKAALAAKEAEAQRLAEAEQAAATKVAEANTASASLAQQALSVLQQPGQVEKLIASAKNLTGQNKYAEALKIVAELAKLKLSPEQQAMVDQVKQLAEQQLAKAMAAKAVGAAAPVTDIPAGEQK